MKWVTLEEFIKLKIPVNKDFEQLEKLVVEVNKFYPVKIMVRLDENDGKQYLQYAEVRLCHPEINITVKYDDYQKKYYVYADMREHFKNIDHNTISGLARNLTAPNIIGVLSAKKIQEWVNYYEDLYKLASVKNKENGSERDKFLKSLEGLPVQWSQDKKQGWIRKNGIEFSFEIGDTYVFKKMEVHYSTDTSIEVFKLLSDNKYKEPKA